MNPKMINIYALIILECRLSKLSVSRIFKIDYSQIEETFLRTEYRDALNYLFNYESQDPRVNDKKGVFKATLLLSQLKKILEITNVEERNTALSAFVSKLSGHDLEFLQEDKRIYTDEEKLAILKFQLKFRLAANEIQSYYGIRKATIGYWRNNCPDADLKLRLEILKEFHLATRNQKLSHSR